MPFKLYIWDTGTTGTNSSSDALHTLAAIEHDSVTPLLFSALISPWNNPHPSSFIPSFRSVFSDFSNYIRETCPPSHVPLLVAHNAPFDASFFAAELARNNIQFPPWRFACSLHLVSTLLPSFQSHSQKSLAAAFGIRIVRDHHAEDDVSVLRLILLALQNIATDDVTALLAKNSFSLHEMAQGYGTSCFAVSSSKDVKKECVVYYTTRTGKYYHMKRQCWALKLAKKVFEKEQPATHLTPCPYCAYEREHSEGLAVEKDGSQVDSTPADSTASFKAFYDHKQIRSDAVVDNASQVKQPNEQPYITTRTGRLYHMDSNCSSLRLAKKLVYVQTKPIHLDPCWKCCPADMTDRESVASRVTRSRRIKDSVDEQNERDEIRDMSSEVKSNHRASMYFRTRTGYHYHVKSDCAGLVRAKEIIKSRSIPRKLFPCTKCCVGSSAPSARREAKVERITRGSTLSVYEGSFWKTATGTKFHTDRNCKQLRNRKVWECNPENEQKNPCRTCSVTFYQDWEVNGLLYY